MSDGMCHAFVRVMRRHYALVLVRHTGLSGGGTNSRCVYGKRMNGEITHVKIHVWEAHGVVLTLEHPTLGLWAILPFILHALAG